jgi:hypothetical protein
VRKLGALIPEHVSHGQKQNQADDDRSVPFEVKQKSRRSRNPCGARPRRLTLQRASRTRRAALHLVVRQFRFNNSGRAKGVHSAPLTPYYRARDRNSKRIVFRMIVTRHVNVITNNLSRLLYKRHHDLENEPVVSQTAGQHEQVEQFMEPEEPRPESGPAQQVEHRAQDLRGQGR